MTDSMARSQATESRKTLARQAFDGMVIRICPVTGGVPTRMLRQSFERLCERYRDRVTMAMQRQAWSKGGEYANLRFCADCGGEVPPELDFIDAGELDAIAGNSNSKETEGDMASQRKPGKCDICGKHANVKSCYNYTTCSTCETVVRTAKLRPQEVLRLIAEYHGSTYSTGHSGLADQIRKALRVPDDTAADELPGLIGDLMRERVKYAAECRRLAGKSLDGGGDGAASPARQGDFLLASILEAMEGESVVDAAKRMKDVVVSLQNDMAVIAAAVGCKMDGVVDEVQRIVHQFATVGTASGLAKDIKKALNVPGDVVADELPGLITDLMRERGQYAAELDRVRKALEAAVDEDLVEVATSMVNELREARSIEYVLEEKSAPADHVSVSRLLSDHDLLASINTLSDALRN